MIRIILDLYEEFSPYDIDDWIRIKKTRWSGDDNYSEVMDDPKRLEKYRNKRGKSLIAKLSQDDMKQFKERIHFINKINRKLMIPNCKPDPGDPFFDLTEPHPIYDPTGKRVNTLECRYREKLENDKNLLIYHLIQLNPTYSAPSNYKAPVFENVQWFPSRKYPDANFIGAILGPRGNTQKRLEKQSGCKIAIRGKLAEKGIVRSYRNPRTLEEEELPNHVYITAPTEDKLEKGVQSVIPLLKPQTHLARMEQMKELALINGTFRFDMRCKECGEMGHKDFQCPQKRNTYFANVQCEKCGDISHVTKDCPKKGLFQSDQKELEIEYKQFVAEINGEDPVEAKRRAVIESKIEQARKDNEEVFESKKLMTKVTVMKPTSSSALVLSPEDEKLIKKASMTKLGGINDKRNFLYDGTM